MENEEDTKERIGEECWNLIMNSVADSTLSSQKMQDLAYGLGVGGSHKRRIKEVSRLQSDRREMIRIFGDWYAVKGGLATMSTQEAVEKLIELFRKSTIGLNPLASALKRLLKNLHRWSWLGSYIATEA